MPADPYEIPRFPDRAPSPDDHPGDRAPTASLGWIARLPVNRHTPATPRRKPTGGEER
jgi:hypothetical protein